MTFSSDVIDFYKNFDTSLKLSNNVVIHNPFDDPQRRAAIETFYKKYFSDSGVRSHLLGINPSRLSQTATGVNYTDGFALSEYCGIQNEFSKTRELTADFFYRIVQAMGGAEKFYSKVFAWAMMPLSVTQNNNYVNYYDTDVRDALAEAVQSNVKWTSGRPSNGRAIIVGVGENRENFEELKGSPFGYNRVTYLPHPRWIMQYNRDKIDMYIEKYLEALS